MQAALEESGSKMGKIWKVQLLTEKIRLNLKKRFVKCFVWGIIFVGSKTKSFKKK